MFFYNIETKREKNQNEGHFTEFLLFFCEMERICLMLNTERKKQHNNYNNKMRI